MPTTPDQPQQQPGEPQPPASTAKSRQNTSPPPAPTFRQPELNPSEPFPPSVAPVTTPVKSGASAGVADEFTAVKEPTTPGKTTTGSSPASFVDPGALQDAARAGVEAISVQLHQILARDEMEIEAGVWLAEEKDARGIGDPIASIMARRSGDLGAGNPDLADAIRAGIALVAYLVKQLNTKANLRRFRRGRGGAIVVDGDGQAEQAAA